MSKILSFDIDLFVSTKQSYRIELTENYEGDKYHCVVYDYSTTPDTHVDTQGFENEKQVFDFIRGLSNEWYIKQKRNKKINWIR
mgnify:CR=1 FL=1